MPRLFAAIDPPDPVKKMLLLAMGGVEGARWQTGEQLHLTLRFVGEVDGSVARDAAMALAGVRMAPFSVAVDGVGLFGDLTRPRALWAGISPAGDLTQLHQKIDRALVQLGLPAEGRAYKPHVTLARFSGRRFEPRAQARLAEFLAGLGGLSSAPFQVGQFALYSSHPGHDGPVYHQEQIYDLA